MVSCHGLGKVAAAARGFLEVYLESGYKRLQVYRLVILIGESLS